MYNDIYFGFWENDGSSGVSYQNMAYGISLAGTAIQIYGYSTSGSTVSSLSSQFTTGDTLRFKLKLKTGGGAFVEIFKNGDFTTPYTHI